jgi:transcriptional regulator with XRE-family HTH domain
MKLPLPGRGLRDIREQRGLTLKDVELQSRRISETRRNQEYLFTAGRLSQVENSFSLPSLYKLASLSEIYRTDYGVLLRLYGIETQENGPGNGAGNYEDKREQNPSLEPSPLWV